MRAPKQEANATAGVSAIMSKFQLIGWAPVENRAHDLGTDLLIEARDERRFARGVVVGAQAKAGPSWFNSPHSDESNLVDGWWFYESSAAHFDDWVCHTLPHLVVLHDIDANISYWVHVTPESCVVTGMGCKVLVPKTQTVDRDHLDALLVVAASQVAAGSFQGIAFSASAAGVPPARRLRYALLAPRLVAPHPNTGVTRPLEPEEAVALLSRRRFISLIDHVKKFPNDVPDPRADFPGQDWRWSFVRALWLHLDNRDHTALSRVHSTAPNSQCRAAVEATLAAIHYEAETHGAGVDLLTASIERDDLSPLDLAWISVHRARLNIELGNVRAARADASLAIRNLRGDDDDVTAALIKGVATSIFFGTSEWGDKNLGDLVNANDNAISWWRSQMVSWALEHVVKDLYAGWAGDRSLSFSAEDEAGAYLLATMQGAGWSADQEAWKGMAARLGRTSLLAGAGKGQIQQMSYGLEMLRRAGDIQLVKLAVRKLLASGPAAVVRSVAEAVAIDKWFHTSAGTNLELWRQGADALSEDFATKAAQWCADRLASSDLMAEFKKSCHPTFAPSTAIADAFVRLVPSSSVSTQRIALDVLVAAPAGSTLFSEAYSRVVFGLDNCVLRGYGFDVLRGKAIACGSTEFAASMFFALSEAGDTESGDLLLKQAVEGDLRSIGLIAAARRLDETSVAALSAILKSRVEVQVSDAHRGHYGMFGIDAARLLANLGLEYRETAEWEFLFRFLRNPRVASEHKEGVCTVLAQRVEEIDLSIKIEILQILEPMRQSRVVMPGGSSSLPALILQLGLVLGASRHTDLEAIACLLTGDADQRCVGSRLVGLGRAPELRPALLSLVSDPEISVRVVASRAVGVLTRNGDDSRSTQIAMGHAIRNSGVEVPCAVLAGLHSGRFDGPTWALEMVESLQASSVSRRVRSAASEFLMQVAAKHGSAT